jgi:hypothetical protein
MTEDKSIILDVSKARSKGNSNNNRYYCSYCNTRLTALTREDMIGGYHCRYHCTKCVITYWPNQQPVKKSNRFETPGPDTNEHGDVIRDKTIPIAVIDDNLKEVSSITTAYKQVKLPAAYEALRKAGFTFTSFEER